MLANMATWLRQGGLPDVLIITSTDLGSGRKKKWNNGGFLRGLWFHKSLWALILNVRVTC